MARAKVANPTTPKKRSASQPARRSANQHARKRAASAVQQRGRRVTLRRWRNYGISLCMIVLFAGIGIAYEQRVDRQIVHWAQNLWLDSTVSAGFTFSELIVEGRKLTPPEDVMQAVGLGVGDSLFLVSLEDMRQRLMALDTVRDASITRDLSGRIMVTLRERRPYALWQHHGVLRVIDEEGMVLTREQPSTYPYLVTVVGEQAPEHMRELTLLIAGERELAERVVAAVYVSNRRWDIHFDNGVQVLLPELDPQGAWQKLAQMHREHSILSQKVESIDLRIDERMFITLPEESDTATKGSQRPASDV